MQYRADAATCNACPVKSACTTSNRGRHVHRSFLADYLDRVKAYELTFAYQKALNKRKVWVEPLFGEGKQWHGMRRFRLRRLWRVNCEALLIASGQNLKRVLQKRGWGKRPFPTEAVALVPPLPSQTEKRLENSMRSIPTRKIAATLMTTCSLGVVRLRSFLSHSAFESIIYRYYPFVSVFYPSPFVLFSPQGGRFLAQILL